MTDIENLLKKSIDKAEEYFKNKNYIDAEELVAQILKVDPNHLQALQMHAFLKYMNKDYNSAIELFTKALDLNYKDANLHSNISLCYSVLHKMKAAMYHAYLAAELDPNKYIYYNNLGLHYKSINMPEIAIKYLNKALEMNSSDSTIWSNLGATYSAMRDMKNAAKYMEKAIELIPDNPELKVNLANVYFFLEQYEKAWELYEYRMQYFEPAKYLKKYYSIEKQWDGKKDLKNKKLVIFSEQGAGDGIHFSRFMKNIMETGCNPIIHTLDPGLKELFNYNFCESTLEPVNEYDYYCSLVSLPYLMNIKEISGRSYLKTNKKIDLSIYNNFYKIGIVWGGNPQHSNDVMRSCKLSLFRKIYNIENVKLFCLQKDLRKRTYSFSTEPVDLAEGCDDLKIVDMRDNMNSFLDTAAIVNELDLVISVDTSILHLSGALGKKTYGILPYVPDWRWGLEGKKTIWYNSMELFRQSKPGVWDDVFDEIKEKVINNI